MTTREWLVIEADGHERTTIAPAAVALLRTLIAHNDRVGWPEAPQVNPDASGLYLPCSFCGEAIPFDYEVDDAFWRAHVPEEWRRDALCLPCLDKIAPALDALKVVYWTGQTGTVALVPVHTRRDDKQRALGNGCQGWEAKTDGAH